MTNYWPSTRRCSAGRDGTRQARLVELRYFAGMTGEQAAKVLGISPATADRHWAFAKAWLRNEVRGAVVPDSRIF